MFSPPHLLSSRQWARKRVGLLGGSFNPPHSGHVHISLLALKMLRLDAVWWLVSPQNPLKDHKITRPYEERFQACQNLVKHPRVLVSNIEKRIQTKYTFQTIDYLTTHFPSTDFIWLSGMDNALTFHLWERWRDILDLVPTAHIARPPALYLIRNCPLKLLKTQSHKLLTNVQTVSMEPHNTYWIKQKKLNFESSTNIRNSSK